MQEHPSASSATESLEFSYKKIVETNNYNNTNTHNMEESVSDENMRRCNCSASGMKSYLCSEKGIELISCLFIGALVAYIPALLVPMNERPIPYQISENSNEVILDLTKYQEWVNATIPTVLNSLISLFIPFIIQIIISICYGEENDAHLSVCVYAIANGISEMLVSVFKKYIGYLRPNFYNRCEFNFNLLECEGEEEIDARKSFPSGHSSLSFCCFTIFTLYLLRVFGVFSRKRKSTFLRRLMSLSCLAPMIIAFFVAASRVHDDYHHPADVVAGSLIGWGCARIVFEIWFCHEVQEN